MDKSQGSLKALELRQPNIVVGFPVAAMPLSQKARLSTPLSYSRALISLRTSTRVSERQDD